MTLVLSTIILILSITCISLRVQASAPDAAAQERDPEKLQAQEQPDTGLDPTVQTSKIGLQNLFTKQPQGAYLDQFILRGTYAFGFSGKNDCSVSVALPTMAHFDPGNMPRVASATGLGDTNLEFVKIFALGKLAHAAVLDVWFRPSNPNLGDTASTGTVLGLGYATSYPLTPNLRTLFFVQYQWTVEQAAGTASVSNLKLRPFLICYLPHSLFTLAEFRVNPDFQNNNTELTPSVVLGRFFGPKQKTNLTVTLDVPVDRFTRANNEKFKLKITWNYFFQ